MITLSCIVSIQQSPPRSLTGCSRRRGAGTNHGIGIPYRNAVWSISAPTGAGPDRVRQRRVGRKRSRVHPRHYSPSRDAAAWDRKPARKASGLRSQDPKRGMVTRRLRASPAGFLRWLWVQAHRSRITTPGDSLAHPGRTRIPCPEGRSGITLCKTQAHQNTTCSSHLAPHYEH